MIVNNLYPNKAEYTISGGTGYTPEYDTLLTDDIENLAAGKMDSYFLYYIPWEEVPQVFHKSEIRSSSNYLEAIDITPPQNVGAGFVAQYKTSGRATAEYFGACEEWVENNGVYDRARNSTYQLYNNMSIRKTAARPYTYATGTGQFANSRCPFFALIRSTSGSYYNAVPVGFTNLPGNNYTNFYLGTYTIPSTTLSFQLYAQQGGNPETVNITFPNITASNLSNGIFTFTDNGWEVNLMINNYGIYEERDINVNGEITPYTYTQPLLRFVENGKIYYRTMVGGQIRYPSLGGGFEPTSVDAMFRINFETGIIEPGSSGYSPMKAHDDGDINTYFSGFHFKVGKAALRGLPVGSIVLNGNCVLRKFTSTVVEVYTYYTPEEVLKHLRLFPRTYKDISIPNEYAFSDNYGIPYIDNEDIFQNQYNFGDLEDIENKLRPWQLEMFQESDFDPDNIPEYEPSEGPTPVPTEGKYSGDNVDITAMRNFTVNGVQYYALSERLVQDFCERLWSQPKSFYEAIQIAGRQQDSIFDFIESLRYYPINWAFEGTPEVVHMGTGAVLLNSDGVTPVQYAHVSNGVITGYNVGSWNLNDEAYHWRGNFLDYAPYTKISVYVPYVGTMELDPASIASHSPINEAIINLDVSMDISTGCMTIYLVNNNGTVLAQKTTKIAIDLFLSGNDATQQSASILRAQFNTTKSVLGGVLGPISALGSGNAAGALTGLGNAYSTIGGAYLENSLAKKQIPIEVQSQGGTASNIYRVQQPFLTIYRQKYSNPENYGHTTGFLVDGTYKISAINGFTVCRNVDVSSIGQAIDKEKAEIKKILESGFYA